MHIDKDILIQGNKLYAPYTCLNVVKMIDLFEMEEMIMAVYGVGAYYGWDVTKEFIDKKCFCIGYNKSDATTLYEMLRRAKIGDIVYIKSFSPSANEKITIKAVGFIIGRNIKEFYFNDGQSMGYGREVRWVKDFSDCWQEIKLTKEDSVNNVYSNTMYEEYSSRIIKVILDMIVE